MGEYDELKRQERAAYEVSPDEFYRDFRDVANLVGERPIVERVRTNTGRIRALELKYYAVLGAIGSAAVLAAILRLSGVTGGS